MKILLISPYYPRPDAKNPHISTNVVHYFAKEWVNLGDEVLVIHNPNIYCRCLYYLPDKIKYLIKTKTGKTIQDISLTKKISYEMDAVHINRLPLSKKLINKSSSRKVLKNHIENIMNIVDSFNFKPDIIIGHWLNPELQILSCLKEKMKIPTALILHGSDYIDDKRFDIEKYKNNIDVFGCRSITDVRYIQQKIKLNYKPFVCYSGIPNQLIESTDFNFKKIDGLVRILYVGELISRKNVIIILEALCKVNFKYHFDIIGVGAEEKVLKNFIKQHNIEKNVTFHGLKKREEVYEFMKNSNIFIMLSKKEIFGLVYLEAMCCGCLVIASKNEGIDGVIINNKNGYLLDADDVGSLYHLLEDIVHSNFENIVRNGYETAVKYTDTHVAQMYLENIKKSVYQGIKK